MPTVADLGRARGSAASFLLGLLLALASSGGIAGERVTAGALWVGVAANAVATLAALGAFAAATRWALAARGHLVAQAMGAAVGVALVHAVLARAVALPWLSERPAQFVNDAVAVSCLLALVWGSARGLDPRVLAGALAVATVYRLTAPAWHLDRAPGGFETTVQQVVVAELVAAAVALALFRTVRGRELE